MVDVTALDESEITLTLTAFDMGVETKTSPLALSYATPQGDPPTGMLAATTVLARANDRKDGESASRNRRVTVKIRGFLLFFRICLRWNRSTTALCGRELSFVL